MSRRKLTRPHGAAFGGLCRPPSRGMHAFGAPGWCTNEAVSTGPAPASAEGEKDAAGPSGCGVFTSRAAGDGLVPWRGERTRLMRSRARAWASGVLSTPHRNPNTRDPTQHRQAACFLAALGRTSPPAATTQLSDDDDDARGLLLCCAHGRLSERGTVRQTTTRQTLKTPTTRHGGA